MIRLILAEDQSLLRNALSSLLSLEDDFTVVGTASSGADVIPLVEATCPDIALLDIHLPVVDGLSLVPMVFEVLPEIRIILLTSFGRPGYARRAMDAGAHGFLDKEVSPKRLFGAIRDVHAGGRAMDAALAMETMMFGTSPLSARETDVLRAAATAMTTAEISRALHLSPGVVRNYLSSAFGKLNASTRVEAINTATERGWLS